LEGQGVRALRGSGADREKSEPNVLLTKDFDELDAFRTLDPGRESALCPLHVVESDDLSVRCDGQSSRTVMIDAVSLSPQ
jgi:hypothetical protein